jgi:nicotinamide-nucleotide amidase
MPGTAPGLVCPVDWPNAQGGTDPKVIYAVPGVPWEMQEMMTGTILPDLQRRAGLSAVIASRTLRTWGESESGLGERLGDRITALDAGGGATLAFLASGAEGLKVRITAKGPDASTVAQMLDAEEVEVRKVLGPLVFGIDGDTMESVVLQMLRERGLTLAVAESLTGGLIGARLTGIPGASDVFRGAVVSYASDVKFDLLEVPQGPVVTEAAAVAMADGVRRRLHADVGVAATGVAGPDPQEDRPPGTVCLAVVIGDPDAGGSVVSSELRLPGRRNQVREFSVITLLGMLRRQLLQQDGETGAG